MNGRNYPQPCHPESERAVLGAMLRSADAAGLAFEALQPEDFYDAANREIYSAMQMLGASGQPVDLVTLDGELTRRGRLDSVGGAAYLIEISRSVPTAVNAQAYIKIVAEKATLRKLLDAAEQITRSCLDGMEETQDVLQTAEKLVYDITMRRSGGEITSAQTVMLDVFGEIERRALNGGAMDGVPSGYGELDKLLNGFHPGEMIVVAGRPAMGKTSLGMNFIENAALRTGKKALVFSLEMPENQIGMRMLSTEARVDMQTLARGQLDEREWARICDAMQIIGRSSVFIDATPGITVSQMRSKARRLQMEQGLDIILIDYLSLMGSSGKYGTRQEEVANISRSIKALALELKVPIIALQQLSRAPVGRADHRPMLSDLRESGAIEQDADVVIFVHREDYYNPTTEEKGVAELIIAKQRNGPLGTVKLGWLGEYTWFIDLAPNGQGAN